MADVYSPTQKEERNIMITKTTTFGGALLVVTGLLGFAAPGFMGMHLSAAHNVVLLLSGALGNVFWPDSHAGGGAHLLPCAWSGVWPARSGGFRCWRNGLHLHYYSGSTGSGSGNNGPSGSPALGSGFPVSRMGLASGHSHASDALANETI